VQSVFHVIWDKFPVINLGATVSHHCQSKMNHKMTEQFFLSSGVSDCVIALFQLRIFLISVNEVCSLESFGIFLSFCHFGWTHLLN